MTSIADTGTLTGSQEARRERMLAAALELGRKGGWDSVQMREVANRAEVALGTLYRYFPSKEHLLVSVMLGQVDGLADRLAVKPPTSADPVKRVVEVLTRANENLQREPEVTRATIRALVAGNHDVAPVVSEVRDSMRRIIADALGEEPQGSEQRLLEIDLLSDVWLAVLVSWISGVLPIEGIVPRIEDATLALLG